MSEYVTTYSLLAVWMLGNRLADDLDLHRGVEHGQWHWPSALVQYNSSAPIKTTRYSSKTVPYVVQINLNTTTIYSDKDNKE